MKFAFFGDFVEERKRMIEDVGFERGHTHGGPADVIFMMGYERNIAQVERAAGFGVSERPILVLRSWQPVVEEERAFFKTRKVMDIVTMPWSTGEINKLFEALEAGDTTIYAPYPG